MEDWIAKICSWRSPRSKLRGIKRASTDLNVFVCTLGFLGFWHNFATFLHLHACLLYLRNIPCSKILCPIILLLVLGIFQILLLLLCFLLFALFSLDCMYIGTDCTKKCAWSLSTPISKKFISYLFSISLHIFLNSSSTFLSSNTTRLYFAGVTMWYIKSDTLWLLCIYLLSVIHSFYFAYASEASFGELNPVEINKIIHVSHFPPGTSKWNKIEHKMFCFISKNWRGKPLVDRATIVQLIANTTTKKGLTIRSKLDERIYKKGIKVSDDALAQINIVKDDFHGEWNYQIIP